MKYPLPGPLPSGGDGPLDQLAHGDNNVGSRGEFGIDISVFARIGDRDIKGFFEIENTFDDFNRFKADFFENGVAGYFVRPGFGMLAQDCKHALRKFIRHRLSPEFIQFSALEPVHALRDGGRFHTSRH
jgi:hypothetical protein